MVGSTYRQGEGLVFHIHLVQYMENSSIETGALKQVLFSQHFYVQRHTTDPSLHGN
jgi:hypothetical protein